MTSQTGWTLSTWTPAAETVQGMRYKNMAAGEQISITMCIEDDEVARNYALVRGGCIDANGLDGDYPLTRSSSCVAGTAAPTLQRTNGLAEIAEATRTQVSLAPQNQFSEWPNEREVVFRGHIDDCVEAVRRFIARHHVCCWRCRPPVPCLWLTNGCHHGWRNVFMHSGGAPAAYRAAPHGRSCGNVGPGA